MFPIQVALEHGNEEIIQEIFDSPLVDLNCTDAFSANVYDYAFRSFQWGICDQLYAFAIGNV